MARRTISPGQQSNTQEENNIQTAGRRSKQRTLKVIVVCAHNATSTYLAIYIIIVRNASAILWP